MSIADLPDEAPDIGKLSLRYLKQNLLLPLSVTDSEMVVVMANPRDKYALKALSHGQRQRPLIPQVGVASEIENGIEKLYGGGRSAMGQIIDTLDVMGMTLWKISSICVTWLPKPRSSGWST